MKTIQDRLDELAHRIGKTPVTPETHELAEVLDELIRLVGVQHADLRAGMRAHLETYHAGNDE